jgi:hypothetical protein
MEFSPNSASIIDVAIGVVDTIAASNFKAFNKRFGIRDSFPYISDQSGRLGINQEPEDVELVFKTSALSPEIIFPAKLFNPSLNAIVPESERKIRITSSWFNLIFNPSVSGKYSFDVNFDSWIDFEELRRSLKLIEHLIKQTNETQLVCRTSQRDINVLRIPQADSLIISIEAREVANCVVDIVNSFDQPPSGLVSLNDSLHYKNEIVSLKNVLQANTPVMQTRMRPTEPMEEYTKDFAVVSAAAAPIGPNIYAALVVCSGPPTACDDGSFEITDEHPIVSSYLVITRDNIEWELLSDEMETVATKYEDTHHAFLNNSNHGNCAES